MKSPPSPPAHWLWGHTKMMFKDPMEFPVYTALHYKPVCQLNVAGMKMYITANIECVKQIFVNQTENFVKGPAFKTLSLLGGNGLLNSEGDFWKRQRRLAQPAFHKEKLKGFLHTFIECSKDFALKWKKYNEQDIYKISFEMGELTLKITGKTLFSIDLSKEATSIPPDVKESLLFLNKRIYSVPRYPIGWPLPSHKRFFQNKKRLDEVVYKIIDEHMKETIPAEDLLQTFLDATDLDTGEKMSREHLRDEVITLFLAGFETTSIGLTWVWYMLSQHDHVRKKFIEELDRIIGKSEVKPEHIMQLTYTRALVDETLRLYPPAYYVTRQLVKDTDMHGYHLKKGCIILTSILGLHKNPDYWQNPDQFDPERFTVKNQPNIIKGSYMPFGTGQRLCIGNQFALMEMVSVLAVLGRQFFLRPASGYIPQMIPSITTNISEGMPMHISSINEIA